MRRGGTVLGPEGGRGWGGEGRGKLLFTAGPRAPRSGRPVGWEEGGVWEGGGRGGTGCHAEGGCFKNECICGRFGGNKITVSQGSTRSVLRSRCSACQCPPACAPAVADSLALADSEALNLQEAHVLQHCMPLLPQQNRAASREQLPIAAELELNY